MPKGEAEELRDAYTYKSTAISVAPYLLDNPLLHPSCWCRSLRLLLRHPMLLTKMPVEVVPPAMYDLAAPRAGIPDPSEQARMMHALMSGQITSDAVAGSAAGDVADEVAVVRLVLLTLALS